MTAASKVSVKSKPEPKVLPQPVELPNTEPHLEAPEPDHGATATVAPPRAQKQEAAVMTTSQTPAIMNTTLDLLENSDADLPVEPQDKIDDVRKLGYSWNTSPVNFHVNPFFFFFFFWQIVMNLCDALEAMPTPSGSLDGNQVFFWYDTLTQSWRNYW